MLIDGRDPPALPTVGRPKRQPGLNVDGDGRPSIRSEDHSTNDTTGHTCGNRAAGLRVSCNRCRKPDGGGCCEYSQRLSQGQLRPGNVKGLPQHSDHFGIVGTFGDVVHYWPQFSADPGSTLGLGFGAVYAIRPVKPSFLPVQPCAKMTAVVPAGVIGRMGP
jgi:hypothetical protein